MIDNTHRKHLLSLMQTQSWTAVETVAEALKAAIQNEEHEYATEWDMVRITLDKEGQVRGINRLFNELYKEARNEPRGTDNTVG